MEIHFPPAVCRPVGGRVTRRKLFDLPFVPTQLAAIFNGLVDVALIGFGLVGLVAVIIGIGTPIKKKSVESALLRIGFANSAGEVPFLLAIRQRKPPYSHITIYEFEQNGIPISRWESQIEKLGVALNRIVCRVELSKNQKKVIAHTVDARTRFPSVIHWDNSRLSTKEFVLNLGVSFIENVSVDLTKTPHILLGGSTGSGKSRLLKLLIWQALLKDAVVHIADFKGGVDYSPIWHEKCKICVEEPALLELLDSLINEMEQRTRLFQQAGVPDIEHYNQHSEKKLQRHILAFDEVAQVLNKAGQSKERKAQIEQIESRLFTLAQQGRAFGIHLILCTQRPDSNILNGGIKSNLDVRICGKADSVLSQIILDSSAATEQIPEDSQGRFLTKSGVVFQAYLLEDSDLKEGV